ncbi:MAG: hypothetical protein ABI602_04570 [Candidatus Saccharibacteria bacterium]
MDTRAEIPQVSPHISVDIVARTFKAARADLGLFCEAELAELASPLKELHGRQTDKLAAKSPDEAGRWAAGYLLANRILREAAVENSLPLPAVSRRTVLAYADLVERYPNRLLNDFDRDYAAVGHVAVVDFIQSGFAFPANRVGAMLLSELYGRFANPARGPVLIPDIAAPPATGQRRRATTQQIQIKKTR